MAMAIEKTKALLDTKKEEAAAEASQDKQPDSVPYSKVSQSTKDGSESF